MAVKSVEIVVGAKDRATSVFGMVTGAMAKMKRGVMGADRQSRMAALSANMLTGSLRSLAAAAGLASASFLAYRAARATVTTSAGFEQSMARVKALTGETGDQFRRLSELAQEMGRTTQFTASDAAEAMSFFALAGFKTEKIMAALKPTLNLAAAGQLQISEAADIAAKIMAGMGIEADQLAGTVDILTKAMTTANTDLRQLGDAMKFVGPIAKSAGIPIEEIVASIQMLSNAGIQAEMAGTTMRGALLSLTSPSAEASQTLKQLGVNVLDAAGNVRPLADILGDFERALDGLGSGKRLEIIGKVFNARQAAGFAELISQGSDRLREMTRELQSAGGVAERVATVQMDTLHGSFLLLKSAAESASIAIGEMTGGPLRAGIDRLTRFVETTSRILKLLGTDGAWGALSEDIKGSIDIAMLNVRSTLEIAGAWIIDFFRQTWIRVGDFLVEQTVKIGSSIAKEWVQASLTFKQFTNDIGDGMVKLQMKSQNALGLMSDEELATNLEYIEKMQMADAEALAKEKEERLNAIEEERLAKLAIIQQNRDAAIAAARAERDEKLKGIKEQRDAQIDMINSTVQGRWMDVFRRATEEMRKPLELPEPSAGSQKPGQGESSGRQRSAQRVQMQLPKADEGRFLTGLQQAARERMANDPAIKAQQDTAVNTRQTAKNTQELNGLLKKFMQKMPLGQSIPAFAR